MGRNKRAPPPASSVYPPTPVSGRASSIFPYSVDRPPTGFITPPVPQFDMNLISPPNASGPKRELDPFSNEENEEEIPIDTRETPMYARSDWGGTTGVRTAFDADDFPRQKQLGVPPLSGGENEGRRTSSIGDGPKTIWSRSSYHSQDQDQDQGEDLDPRHRPRPELGDDNDDVYTGQAPDTAWTRDMGPYHTPPLPAIASTPLPETPIRPPRHPARSKSKSRHSVKNQSYGSALKRAGSRKASELVDISELSEDSRSHHSPVYSHHGPRRDDARGAQVVPLPGVDNPFSPVFAAASQDSRGMKDDPTMVPLQSAPSRSSAQMTQHHRSTLPSILDLEHLGARSSDQGPGRPRSAGPLQRAGPGGGGDLVLEPPTFPRPGGAESPRLLTPEAQNRLGRMSVATARYSLPPSRSNNSGSRARSRSSNPNSHSHSTASASSAIRSLATSSSWASRMKRTKVIKWYLTWRVFLTAGHTLMAALLVVIALADPASGRGFIVKIEGGGLGKMPADGHLGLGASEWCQLVQKGVCSVYATGDFQNDDDTFKVPNGLIDILYPIWTALASILCLQALFTLSTAFLHFYVFYILGIPFNHLVTPNIRPDLDEHGDSEKVEEEDLVQKEVDIRARCERPPFEEYIWLWWAWWAFRRGPVGHVYGFMTGGLGLVASGIGYRFKSQLAAAAASGSVSFGMGGVLPLIVFGMVLDPFISAVKYFIFSPRTSFNTFLNPPDPTPAAVLLPQAEKPLARRRRATGLSTFFAPPTSARFTRGQTLFQQDLTPIGQGEVPPLPPSEVDDETRRWLAEYPKDPELVPLITDLRQGGHNDDFLLSDVGLLYLRPDEDDLHGSGAALLVPPNGVIRAEVLEDAHIEGEGEHKGYLGMMSQLGEVFWWVGMEEDVESCIARCGCARTGTGTGKGGAGEAEPEDGRSMYTGVTGWSGVDEDEKREHALAADMAIAMRRADEDARKKWEA